MEYRIGNIIINVDKILTQFEGAFVKGIAEMLDSAISNKQIQLASQLLIHVCNVLKNNMEKI